MPIEVPKLAEQNYAELVAETLARVPVHNPEWTNFNESDPGVTLVHLFAFLTESLSYRANLIPERSRLKFLTLLGVPLQPASAARGLVTLNNERGPLAVQALSPGVEVRAGDVPFVTERGVDVLPVEARVFYKSDVTDLEPEARAHFENLYRAALEERPGLAPRFYRSVELDPRAREGVDLGATVGQALWIALLARPREDPESVRRLLAGRVLTLGWVPAVAETGRTLAPGVIAGRETSARLVYEVPFIDLGAGQSGVPVVNGVRTPRYRALTASASGNLLLEAGVVELALPPEPRLGFWDDLEPLDSGVGEFPPSLEDTTLEERLVTWLRVRVVGAASVRVSWTGINAAPVLQRERIRAEVLPDGTGEPDQAATLSRRPVLPGTVQVRVLPVGATHYESWAQVDDLLAAGAEVATHDGRFAQGQNVVSRPSKVFVVDAEAGAIRFGDGQRGARPPRGARIVADYDFSRGAGGNVGADTIRSAPALASGITVSNPIPSFGGADAESVAQGEKQITRFLQHRDRLVTAADFEAITWRTPGVAIGRVDVLPSFRPISGAEAVTDAPGVVTVMVTPRFDGRQPDAPQADREFLDAVCAWLEPRRLVTTEVVLRGPEYVDISVSLGLEVLAGLSPRDVLERVHQEIRDFLSPLPAPGAEAFSKEVPLFSPPEPTLLQVRRGWPLRKAVVALEIHAVASRVPGVLLVKQVLLGVRGSTSRAAAAELTGLELPRLTALSVVEGEALALTELSRATDTGGTEFLPIPVVPEVCG